MTRGTIDAVAEAEIPRERALVVLIAMVLGSPLIIWGAWPRSPSVDGPPRGYHAICPAIPGQPMGVIAYDSEYHSPDNGDSYTTYYDRYTAYDPADGKVLARADLGTHRETGFTQCMAVTGDQVWLRTVADGVHVRDARSGKVLKTQAELFAGISGDIDKVWFDADRMRVMVATTDARNHEIVVDGHPRAGPTAFYSPPPALERISAGEIRYDGAPRRMILIGDKVLADADWLDPRLLVHPPSGTLEWANPPSLVVCEKTDVNSLHGRLTRVALDGTILWTYTPAAKPGRSECNWYASGDGSRLILLTDPNGMIAIDAASGRELYRKVQ